VERGARWALAVLVALGPLPFGAVLGWTTALFAACFGLLLLVTAISYLAAPRRLAVGCGRIAAAGGLLALPALLQLVPLPSWLLEKLAPATASFYALNAVDGERWRPLTQDPAATIAALLWLATCIAAAVLVAALFDSRSVRALVLVLLAIGVLEAFYGILEYLSGRNQIFLYEKRYYLDSVTGTYINRNHFAGLMVMLLPVGLAWLLARAGRQADSSNPSTLRQRLLALADSGLNQTVLLALAVAMMGTGLALSFSRAGVTLGLLTMAVVAGIQSWTSPHRRFRRSRAEWYWVGGLLLLALIPLAIRGPGRLATVAEDVPEELRSEAGRTAVWAATLKMAAEHPVSGTGLGTFGQAFGRYRPMEVQSTYTHAHQDYLQWFAETGVIGALAGLAVVAGLALTAVQALKRSEGARDRALAAGICAGLIGFALHSLVDFNGHIPANTLIAAVLAATLVVLARPRPFSTLSTRRASW